MKRVLLTALLAAGCATARAVVDDDLARIDDGMRFEPYSDATPGADGIALGPDAPPLSEVPFEPSTSLVSSRWSSGRGWGRAPLGGYGWGVGPRVSYPGLGYDSARPFGGGTVGGPRFEPAPRPVPSTCPPRAGRCG